ncbi:ABC transporter ATP-binding protein [Microbacterium terricola]|uniref:ABC transporter ATP-binding protein n=1 Tax=Microbacterium terricola TaxID=344163 RepID=A0ABM8DWD1_9MICO|nr:ABC transporter ATP-binding protein [Microbacterium terricola]UYK39314.1 ABC transporter ATP-binding protein [Microbacterium terricola]BDV29963.1 ABC transporter ATP-binding protein [Microbacterium terricola]
MSVSASPQIECVDLVRIFRGAGVEVQALQGLNLRVDRGELTAIVGASGSGKSTLLAILSALDVATAGRARVGTHDLLTLSAPERARYRRRVAGFVWQQTSRNFLPELTITENIALALSLRDTGGSKARATRVDEILDLLGVSHVRGRLPGAMTGGERQRAAIAVALANEPEVLFADEPTGELDDESSALVLGAMRTANEELGVTVLIVTHDPGVAAHVRRAVQIRDGRTSTEVLRSTSVDEGGIRSHVAEEFAVLDRVGRLQLPKDQLDRIGLRDRVRLDFAERHIEVHPAQSPAETEE